MENLSQNVINKIFYFTQHPVAELFKIKFKYQIEDMNEEENFYYQWCDYKEQLKYI